MSLRECSCCKKDKKPEEFGINKTDYFKTCILCCQKLDLPSAKNLQTNNNSDNNEHVEHEILLDDTVDLDNLEDYILTELEACENNLNGIEINIRVVLPSKKFNNNEIDLIFQEVIKIIQAANGYKWNYLQQLQYQSHTLTQKQVHFWWTMFYQKLYLHDDDQFISTTYLLQEDENYLLLYKIAMDATYKTNKAGFELYVVMANIEDVGYPLSYLMLNSLTSMTNKQFKPSIAIQHFCPPLLHNQVLSLMIEHFNYHSHILFGTSGTFLQSSTIYENAIMTMYNFCHVNTKPLDSSTIELDISSNSDN
ncbi:24965_t:CDS:2, partial [Cetraspora pellucida]